MLLWAFRYFVMAAMVAAGFAALGVLPEPAADDQSVPRGGTEARPGPAPGRAAAVLETVLEPDPKGHYWVQAMLNGEPVTFIVDSGASDVILAPDDARRLGFHAHNLRFDRRYHTANGVIEGALVRLRELRIGQQSVYDLDAVVVDAPLAVSLLGVAFLRRLHGYEVRDGRLVLRW